MKKRFAIFTLIIISLFSLTGCSLFNNKRTIDYLMKGYVKICTKADMKAIKDIFPAFFLEVYKESVTKEAIETELKRAKETYGDDFNVTYKIDKEIKFTDEELEKFNNRMINSYKAKKGAKECYRYEGTITLKGSKTSEKLTLSTIARCSFNGKWYLIRK